MRRPKSANHSNSLPKSQPASGKLKNFRPLPYHVALSQAARLEAWTQEVEDVLGVVEAEDSSDFDPRLMDDRLFEY